LASAFPQADVVFVDGMGHHPVQERRDEMLQLLGTGKAPRANRPRRRIRRPLLPIRPTPRFA
jgi:predicted metal-dependent peptidase